MSKKLAYERYHWFHGQIKAEKYPNAKRLADIFEVSHKQAQRDVDFMRDRIGAPLDYNPFRKGYAYQDTGYELPPVWFKEEELLSLCFALRLATTLPDKNLKNSLYNILEKFITFRSIGLPPSFERIKEKVSVKNIQYYKVNETIFHKLIGVLFNNEPVKISYYTPHKDETTERIILPLHLLCYMGSWHLIAFCTLRRGLRDFALSRIGSVDIVTQEIDRPCSLPSIKQYIRKNFGLMSGEESTEVCLKFTPAVSNWVSEQIWHSNQEFTLNKDGSMCLRFPVADFREVRREILKFGASVEVLSPKELKEEIREEIEKMKKIYT